MNVERQINHWIASSNEDMEIAEVLFKEKREIHCLFFCHLALEKMIKASVTKVLQKTPPHIHSLISLSGKANIDLDESTKDFFTAMNNYQLEGRYHGEGYKRPGMQKTTLYFNLTKEKIEWLKKKLLN